MKEQAQIKQNLAVVLECKETFGLPTIIGRKNSTEPQTGLKSPRRASRSSRAGAKPRRPCFLCSQRGVDITVSWQASSRQNQEGGQSRCAGGRRPAIIDNAKRPRQCIVAVWVIKLVKRLWHKPFATIPDVMVFNSLTNCVTFHK